MLIKFSTLHFILLCYVCGDNKIQIKLNITVASSKDKAIIQHSGYDDKLVTDHEINLFNITMSNLNRGFRIELGKYPDGIFLKDPTTYGNLFHKYKWPEVHRHLQIDKIEIAGIVSNETVLKTKEIFNNATDNSIVERFLFHNVENSVFSVWSDEGLPVEETFYDVNINFDGGSFRYKNKWRDASLKSKMVKFGKSIKRNLTIKPGQTIVEKLLAKKTIFVLKIHYKATLIGNVIGDYENLYGKYHFWAPTVNNIMKAANVNNEIRTSERVEIRCYTDPKLVIIDKETGITPVRTKRKLVWTKLTTKNLSKTNKSMTV